MNRKMRHTVHLLIGEELTQVAPLLKQYTLMYGEGDAPDYLQIMSCTGQEELVMQSHIHEKPQEEKIFSSGLENRYRIGVAYQETVQSQADIQQYFISLFNRSVTIEDPGADGSMDICLYLLLYQEDAWRTALRLVEAIRATERRIRIDILGLPAEMALLLCDDDKVRKSLPDRMGELRKTVATIGREIISQPDIHRLLLFEDCNSAGLALNLDRDALIRVCGEFALLYVERYEVLFPTTQMGSKIDITSFGLSLLVFDKVYFVHYLLRKTYLHILHRERVDELEKINVNHAAHYAQQILKRHADLYQQFVHEEVEPVIAQHYRKKDLNLEDTQQLESKLQSRIDAAIEDMQQFITDPSLSLPEKQAIMAQLLGEDDPLIEGVQYQKDQLILDDLDAETINYFIAENNRQKEDDRILTTPVDEAGHVYLPLKEMKLLRARIRQRTTFIRAIETQGENAASLLEGRSDLHIPFNVTDEKVRASIISDLLEEERKSLIADEKAYAKLRYGYEQLLQTLSNPTRRDEIYDQSVSLLKKHIDEEKAVYKEFVEVTRPSKLKTFDRETWHFLVYTIGVVCSAALTWISCRLLLFSTAALVSSIVSGISILFCLFYLWYRKYQKSMLRKELEDEAAKINSRISHLETELQEKHLNMHLAGKVISSLTDMKHRLVKKYHALVTYIQGLHDWMGEEQEKLGEMVVPNRTPCIPLLQNDVLDRYFDDRKEEITREIRLYDLVGKEGMNEEDILHFKLHLRDRLISLLEAEYEDFALVEYVTGKTCYPYLSDVGSGVGELMPRMDQHSDCFLHIQQTGVTSDDTLEKTVFIHTDKQADRNAWRDKYRTYFSQQPGDGELNSRFKLIELQVQNLEASQVALMNCE